MCSSDTEKPKKKSPKKTIEVLFTCYLFLIITCACLLTALVLIGKHLNYRVHYPKNVNSINLNSFQKSPKLEFARLPNDTKPLSYTIVLRPNLTLGSFEGVVDIAVEVKRKKKEIVLHSKNLTINTVELTHLNSSKAFGIESVRENALEQIVVIRSREILLPGLYKMHIAYSGNMLNKLVGFYRSKVKGLNSTRYMATSKFEPTYARQAFPCFDEPNMKAKYKVTLLKPADPEYIALSNYPEKGKTTDPEGGELVEFEETVEMSTYLSCFIVSDFKYTEMSFVNNIGETPFRVYASPDQLDKTTYAGEVGKKAIEYFIKYFNIPYPLPKLDMVAVPDFVSGAMEHWGLVTFRETALLYNENTHSEINKQRVATVVAHELAHSWFGNLVTMDWWDNLWLNEGFASYITYKGVDEAEKDWNYMSQFQIDTLHSILSLDATQSSHPIIQTVLTPDQITEVFDSVSYNKGASILRMLESVVTPDNFQKGVTNYLKAHAYENAVTQDLWDEIQEVVNDDNLNITEFMDTYTVQMGYPILNVEVDGNKYTFTQKRFLSDPESARKQERSSYNYRWNVPITYITDQGKNDQIHWFKHNMDQLTIEVSADAKWIKFNPDQVGYYRVNYPEEDWLKLKENIGNMENIQDQAHLLEESFSIAESGELDYSVPLSLMEFLKGNNPKYVPWSVASSQLIKIAKYFQTSEYETELKVYVHELLMASIAILNWDDVQGEEHAVKLARGVILSLACRFEDEEGLKEARDRFQNWLNSTDDPSAAVPIAPNLRDIVYKYGMQSADKATWDKVFELYNAESDANEKLKLLNGLANVRNPTLLYKLIELAKDETYVRGQDYFTLLQYISANPVGRPIVWDYVRENWEFLVQRFTLNNRYLGSLIPSITSNFLTKTKLQEMKHFFADYPEAGAGAAARLRALENVSNNIKWVEKHRPVVENWLKSRKSSRA